MGRSIGRVVDIDGCKGRRVFDGQSAQNTLHTDGAVADVDRVRSAAVDSSGHPDGNPENIYCVGAAVGINVDRDDLTRLERCSFVVERGLHGLHGGLIDVNRVVVVGPQLVAGQAELVTGQAGGGGPNRIKVESLLGQTVVDIGHDRGLVQVRPVRCDRV